MNQKKIYEELYSLCEKVLDKEPWLDLTDSQLIHLQSNNQKVNVFANTLGNADETYGIVFYKDLNDYSFLQMSVQLNISDYAMMTQSPITLYFDSNDFISPDQQEIYASMEKDFDFPETMIPYFISFEPGFFPYSPSEKELLQLTKYLSLYLTSLDYLPEDHNWSYLEDEDTQCAYFHFDGDKVEGEIVPLEDQGFIQDIPDLEVEALEELRASQSPTSTILEMDIRYFPFPHHMEEYNRPLSVPHIIVVDQATGKVYENQSIIIPPTGDHADYFQLSLLTWIEEHGIPKEVHLRSEYFMTMLQQIQTILGFDFVIDDELPNVDNFWTGLLVYLMDDSPEDVDPQNFS